MDGKRKLHILAFAGSLRKESYNAALINAAKELAPEDVEIEIFPLAGIPLFDQDLEGDMPREVVEFKKKIKNSDAILIATPEYNRSVPGVLKNAIDWASRPYGDNSFEDKPVATMGATGGSVVGTSAAQLHLREIFSFLNMHPLEKPVVYVADAKDKIKNGVLTDESTRLRIRELVEKLAEWARRIG